MPATPVVYIDVVFLVNFVLDATLLWTTGWVLKRKVTVRRVLLGGMVGALYSMAMFVPALSLLTTWPGKALASVLMVYVALPRKSMLDMIRLVSLFYFVSFVFAGASIALGYAVPGTTLSHSIALGNRGLMFATSSGTLALMVAIPLAIFSLQRLMSTMKRAVQKANFLCDVTAVFGRETIHFKGLLDSGNGVCDPVSSRPVSFVDMDVLFPVLPAKVRQATLEGQDLLSAVASLAASASLTLVPFQGASGRGLTVAIRPDKVVITQGSRIWTCLDQHLFAVYPGALSNDATFRAILHMDMMNGDDEDEGIRNAQTFEHEAANPTAATLHTGPSQTTRQS